MCGPNNAACTRAFTPSLSLSSPHHHHHPVLALSSFFFFEKAVESWSSVELRKQLYRGVRTLEVVTPCILRRRRPNRTVRTARELAKQPRRRLAIHRRPRAIRKHTTHVVSSNCNQCRTWTLSRRQSSLTALKSNSPSACVSFNFSSFWFVKEHDTTEWRRRRKQLENHVRDVMKRT